MAVRYMPFLCAGIVFLALARVRYSEHINYVSGSTCHLSPYFSEALRKQLYTFVMDGSVVKGVSVAAIVKTIKEQSPAIKSVSCASLLPDVNHIVIEGFEPSFCINTTHVLTVSGQVLERDMFDTTIVDALPHIISSQIETSGPQLCQEHKKALKDLSGDIFDAYDVKLKEDGVGELHDKECKTFVIRFHASRLPDKKIISWCNQIKREVCLKRTTGAITKKWIADVRFARQIVLSSCSGGNVYG